MQANREGIYRKELWVMAWALDAFREFVESKLVLERMGDSAPAPALSSLAPGGNSFEIRARFVPRVTASVEGELPKNGGEARHDR